MKPQKYLVCQYRFVVAILILMLIDDIHLRERLNMSTLAEQLAIAVWAFVLAVDVYLYGWRGDKLKGAQEHEDI